MVDRADVERFFRAEGDLAAGAWSDASTVMQGAVRDHRMYLLELSADLLRALSPEDEAACLRTYDERVEAARGSTSSSVARVLLFKQSVAERLERWREREGLGSAESTAKWFAASPEALRVAVDISNDADQPRDFNDVWLLFHELGRLCAPAHVISQDSVSAFNSDLEVLDWIAARVLAAELRFDPVSLEQVLYWDAERRQRTVEMCIETRDRVSRDFARHVIDDSPLPAEPEMMTAEVERRRAQRHQITELSAQAQDDLMRSLRETFVAHRAVELEAISVDSGREISGGLPHPGAMPYGVSAVGAELWVRDVLRHLGARSAHVTPPSNDGGVDIVLDDYVVSVKNYSGTVPVEEVREIFAVAQLEGVKASLWTSGTLSVAGLEFAERAGIALVHYVVECGIAEPLNDSGRVMFASLES